MRLGALYKCYIPLPLTQCNCCTVFTTFRCHFPPAFSQVVDACAVGDRTKRWLVIIFRRAVRRDVISKAALIEVGNIVAAAAPPACQRRGPVGLAVPDRRTEARTDKSPPHRHRDRYPRSVLEVSTDRRPSLTPGAAACAAEIRWLRRALHQHPS